MKYDIVHTYVSYSNTAYIFIYVCTYYNDLLYIGTIFVTMYREMLSSISRAAALMLPVSECITV